MNRKKKIHNRITSVLAVIIVVATIYALMLPAITMIRDKDIYCGLDEHKHGSSCYTPVTEENVKTLICQMTESSEHKHTDGCYQMQRVDVDANELRCKLSEGENHSHTDICYGAWEITCGYQEHSHSLACQSNPEADVETSEQYGDAVSRIELIGLLRDDIISIAESQLGYTESEKNFAVATDGETKLGYTRYGEWYGDKYSEWSGMFVSFCLNYARVENSIVSYQADHERRITDLKLKKLYHAADSEYRPRVGDLIFFDVDKYTQGEEDKRRADRVGFVYELICDETKKITAIKVIEGDYNNRVAVNEYDIINDTIIGYGEIPERDISVSLCNCGCEDESLSLHSDNCARREFAEKLGEVKSAKAISKLWTKLPKDVQSAVEEYLSIANGEKHSELTSLIANLPQLSEKTTSLDGLDFSLTGPFENSMEANVSGIEGEKLDGLKEYLKDTDNHLISGAYDISIVDGQSKAYFDEPIKVAISGLDIGKINTKNLRVKVYHLVGVDEAGVSDIDRNTEVEMMYATLDEEGNLHFETDDFSVFYFTVDFHYEDLTYVIDGYSSVVLSTLFENLQLPFNSVDVVNATFSNPEYISIQPVYNENGVIVDWELTSLAPFTTKETLSLSFANGTVFEIDVTDSQTKEYITTGPTTVNVSVSNPASGVKMVATLYKDGVSTGKSIVLDSTNSWKGSFTGLDEGNYTVEYTAPGYLVHTESSYKESNVKYVLADSLEKGNTYVLVHNTNRPVQASSYGSSLSRGSSLSISNGVITSSVSNTMQWYYDGYLKNVGASKYLQLSTSTTANTSSSNAIVTTYSNGKISQKINNTQRYLIYNSGYRSGNEGSATTFQLYKRTSSWEITYEFMLEYIGYNPDDNANSFEHNKNIDYLNDGVSNPDTKLSGEDYYRIYLDMTGKQEPMDLLIIVDGSGSMQETDMDGGMRRDDAITQFLNGSTSKITEDGFISYFLGLNSKNNISIVQFYGDVTGVTTTSKPLLSKNDIGYTFDSEVLLDWTGTAKFVDCTCHTNNGTNYEAGLRRGHDALASPAVRGNGHRKIVLFMSDGVPTFFLVNVNDIGAAVDNNTVIDEDDVGKRYADGTTNYFEYCKDPSKVAFDDFMAANPGVTVFTIGVSEDISDENASASRHPEVMQYMADKGGGEFYCVKNDMHELKLQLETIFYPAGVVIEDKLSKYVRYYSTKPDVVVTMEHKDTKEKTVLYSNGAVTQAGKDILTDVVYTEGDISANPTDSTGTVKAVFAENYRFSPNHFYTMSFNVQTTETAYKDYADSGGYNATGDENTDYATNSTSSLKPGFYSNDNATVTYTISGREHIDKYLHPVVQVATDSLIVKKEWKDSLAKDEHSEVQIALMLNYTLDGVPTQIQIGEPITLSANNGWMYKFQDLAKYHVVDKDYYYSVEELNPPDRYTVDYSYVNENGVYTWVVTNALIGKLNAQKVDSLGNVIPIAGVTFEVYADEALTEKLGTFVTDEEGKFTIDGLVDNKIYWIIETESPPGYTLMDSPQQFKITPNGVDTEILVNSRYLSVNDEGVLLIKNYPGYELPATGSAKEALIYGLGVLLVAVAAIGGLVLKKKNKLI